MSSSKPGETVDDAAPTGESLQQVAYKSIRKLIISGEMRSGTPMVERRLALQLGISRTPVREALSRLEREGLVTSLPGQGAVVHSLTPMDVAEMYDIREFVEALAARLLARRINAEEREKLTRLAAIADDPSSMLGDDEAFHAAIVAMCGNARVMDIVRVHCIHVFTYDERTGRLATNTNAHQFGAGRSSPSHVVIAEQINAGDEAKVESLIRQHVRNGKAQLMRFLLAIDERGDQGA